MFFSNKQAGTEAVVPISTNGACMSEKMFSTLEAHVDDLVDTFKSFLKGKKKGKNTVAKRFSQFVLEHEDGRAKMEKVTHLYIKALVPPALVSSLRGEGLQNRQYATKVIEAMKGKSWFKKSRNRSISNCSSEVIFFFSV